MVHRQPQELTPPQPATRTGHLRPSRLGANADRQARRGFTIAEVLVVVGIIALLVALLFPVFGRVRSAARTAKCLNNQRQLTLANATYATSNKGKWVSPRTDKNGTTYPNNIANQINHCWVKAEGANITAQFEKPAALEQGVLFPYIGNIQTYVSPHEPSNPMASVASNTTTRIRSYSFNALLGTTRPDELPEFDDDFGTALSVPLIKYTTTSVGHVTKPARMLATLFEDDSVAYNNQGWLILP
ncbi:MAG: type II secretion system protein, partial [Phycisphaerae bacterium]|nr:type II secretion system protein [Phycisphaerae bacterium]